MLFFAWLVSLSFSYDYNVGLNQTYPTIFSVVDSHIDDAVNIHIDNGNIVDFQKCTIKTDVSIVGSSRTKVVLFNNNSDDHSYLLSGGSVILSLQTLTFELSNKINTQQILSDVYLTIGSLIAEDVSFAHKPRGGNMIGFFFYFDEHSFHGGFANCSFVNFNNISGFIYFGSYDHGSISFTECLFSRMYFRQPSGDFHSSGILDMITTLGTAFFSSVTFRNFSSPEGNYSGASVLNFRIFSLVDIHFCLFEKINDNGANWQEFFADGGTINADGFYTPSSLMTVNRTTFRYCIVGRTYTVNTGGAIHLHNTTFNILSCLFVNCSAKGYGGAVSLDNSSGIINNTYFVDDYGERRGGAIYINSSSSAAAGNISIKASVFSRNVVGGYYIEDGIYGDDIYVYFLGEKRFQVEGCCTSPFFERDGPLGDEHNHALRHTLQPVVAELWVPGTDPDCSNPDGCRGRFSMLNPLTACSGCAADLSCMGNIGGKGTKTQEKYDPEEDSAMTRGLPLLWVTMAVFCLFI